MNTEKSKVRSADEAAWRKVRENAECYSNALEEITQHFGVLLELRDRKIAELERKRTLPPTPPAIDFGGKDRLDLKLLVVESSGAGREALVSALRRRFHVFSAGDGYAAFHLMVDKPDMILTELDLPYVDGIRMIRYVREIANGIPIVVMSTPKNTGVMSQLRALSVETFIRKPCRLKNLLEKVEAVARTCTPSMKSVLAVCPDVHERHAFYTLLDKRYRTLVAASASAASEMTGARPDVLIVDAAVEDSSWEQVVAAFSKGRDDLKVLALCDLRNAKVVGASESAPVHDVVVRPYRFEDTLAQIRTLIGIEDMGRFMKKVFRLAT